MSFLAIVATIFVVAICAWIALLIIDYIAAATPQPNVPPRFPIATILKALVLVAALIIILDAAFGTHRFLIHV
jgi:hypothetical protein